MSLCPSCPSLYNCQRMGCRGEAIINAIRARYQAESPDAEILHAAKVARSRVEAAVAQADILDVQVSRLDVENGDILVLRTAEKLTQEKSDDFHDRLLELAQRHGVRNVTVVILDGCTDLSIERPGTAMAHQRPRDVPQPMG